MEVPPAHNRVLTLDDLWQEFAADRQLRIAAGSMQENTLVRYHATIKAVRQSLPTLLNKPMSEVTFKDIETFKSLRLKSGVKAATINSDLRSFKTLFNYAVRQCHLDRSPLSEVSNVTVNNGDVRFLNDDELRHLNECLQDLDLEDSFQRDAHDLIIVYISTGCRARELLVIGGLTLNCVGKETLDMQQSKQHRRRVMRLSASVQKILDSRRGFSHGPFDLSYDQTYKRVKYVLSKAKIEDASIHTLRKTAGSLYYTASRDIFATSMWLGHSTVLVTQKHYAGLIQSLEMEYSEAFEHILAEKVVAI